MRKAERRRRVIVQRRFGNDRAAISLWFEALQPLAHPIGVLAIAKLFLKACRLEILIPPLHIELHGATVFLPYQGINAKEYNQIKSFATELLEACVLAAHVNSSAKLRSCPVPFNYYGRYLHMETLWPRSLDNDTTIERGSSVKRRLYLAFLLGLVLSLSLPAGATQAAKGVKVDFSGNTVSAYFQQTDGCIQTQALVLVWDNLNRDEPGPKTRDLRAEIDLVQFGVCDQDPVFLGAASGYGSIAEQDFALSNSLQSAALDTVFPVCDYVGDTGCINLAVHLKWDGTGGMIPAKTYQWHYDLNGCRWYGYTKGDYRQGTAVGTMASATTSYISGATTEVYLTSNSTGYMVRQCDGPVS